MKLPKMILRHSDGIFFQKVMIGKGQMKLNKWYYSVHGEEERTAAIVHRAHSEHQVLNESTQSSSEQRALGEHMAS